MGSRKTKPTGRWSRLLCALACSTLLAGCSGGVRDAVSQAVDQGSSSVATARLAAELGASGKMTAAATSTALDDALKELAKTRTTVVELSAPGPYDRGLRQEALAAMDAAVSAVAEAADAVASQDGRPSAADAGRLLVSAAGGLSELKTRLGTK